MERTIFSLYWLKRLEWFGHFIQEPHLKTSPDWYFMPSTKLQHRRASLYLLHWHLLQPADSFTKNAPCPSFAEIQKMGLLNQPVLFSLAHGSLLWSRIFLARLWYRPMLSIPICHRQSFLGCVKIIVMKKSSFSFSHLTRCSRVRYFSVSATLFLLIVMYKRIFTLSYCTRCTRARYSLVQAALVSTPSLYLCRISICERFLGSFDFTAAIAPIL